MHNKTLELLNNCDFEIIIVNKKMYDRKELIGKVRKLIETKNETINSELLHKEIAKFIRGVDRFSEEQAERYRIMKEKEEAEDKLLF